MNIDLLNLRKYVFIEMIKHNAKFQVFKVLW